MTVKGEFADYEGTLDLRATQAPRPITASWA